MRTVRAFRAQVRLLAPSRSSGVLALGAQPHKARGESASSGSNVPAEPVVYVCESAGNAYYHTYDCDELSLLRQRGYPTSEMTLSEASKLYQPCPVCQR